MVRHYKWLISKIIQLLIQFLNDGAHIMEELRKWNDNMSIWKINICFKITPTLQQPNLNRQFALYVDAKVRNLK